MLREFFKQSDFVSVHAAPSFRHAAKRRGCLLMDTVEVST
jgi:hypothetical protein